MQPASSCGLVPCMAAVALSRHHRLSRVSVFRLPDIFPLAKWWVGINVLAQQHRSYSDREEAMQFMISMRYTDQGMRTIKDAPNRAKAARELAKKMGVEIKS